ncbi:MAG: nitrite/sulfite reductase [Candidatus Brocadiia bacterium]|nr:MAG: nitrite/sulfite reductase [Candidatus Brocadiia bacterium]
MQRIKIFGGRITWNQWRTAAQLADKYCSGTALHITTRQDIEFHNLSAQAIPVVHQALSDAGLTTHGACGDAVRNITVCSGCRYAPNSAFVLPVAELVQKYLNDAAYDSLPRKFKISFSGCLCACAKPWISCLGFIAKHNDLFNVIGAGSLGAKPALGIELYKSLPVKDVPPLCIAAVEFFNEHGDHDNRHKARFRHVREKLGDATFRIELDKRFQQVKLRHTWPDVPAEEKDVNKKLLWRFQLPNGNMEPRLALELADAAEPQKTELRINLEHGLEIYGCKVFQLPAPLAVLRDNPIIVACPGCSTCPKALLDTWDTADKIRHALAGKQLAEKRICISGCPNNCAHSVVADIGLIGLVRKQGQQSVQCCRLYTGGGNGTDNRLALPGDIITAEKVPERLIKLTGK